MRTFPTKMVRHKCYPAGRHNNIIIMYSMLESMYRQGRLGSAAQLKSTIDLVLRLSEKTNKIHVRGLRTQHHEYQFCGFKYHDRVLARTFTCETSSGKVGRGSSSNAGD